ncbi:MFS transporter, SHS family, lactate transporter [Alicyclobacillus hesperidum]|uniref:MFS transporter, SHS family, lactate transporter n=1 Tax=Alicyclobacillus hesperidum TaxID=89784 RepID=A0A1H2R9Z2_9BACL|nr:MFS transporter [Alicyclobacillus hesperidum]SDW16181.1 MFS transporter, SHS family, lactate transporter [Alicyclobacillus hesperidum]
MEHSATLEPADQTRTPYLKALISIAFVWAFDAMDFSILTFVLIDIIHDYRVPLTLAAAVSSATTFARLGGGFLGGILGDAKGRKISLIISIVWFSVFECLTGFSIGFSLLFVVRILYGLGMGAMYANGTPMLMEMMPAKWRGLASGLMQSGFSFGYIFAAILYRLWYNDLGWHDLFFIACIPAVLVAIYIGRALPESTRWQTMRVKRGKRAPATALFGKGRRWNTIHATLIAIIAFSVTYPINTFYATLLKEDGHFSTSVVANTIIILNVAGILGNLLGGWISDYIGRRWTLVVSAVGTAASSFVFLHIANQADRDVFTFLVGFFSIGGVWSVIPTYLAEHCSTQVRSTGQGTTYHIGAALGGAIVPLIVSSLASSVGGLAAAMTYSVAIASVLILILAFVWRESKGETLE